MNEWPRDTWYSSMAKKPTPTETDGKRPTRAGNHAVIQEWVFCCIDSLGLPHRTSLMQSRNVLLQHGCYQHCTVIKEHHTFTNLDALDPLRHDVGMIHCHKGHVHPSHLPQGLGPHACQRRKVDLWVTARSTFWRIPLRTPFWSAWRGACMGMERSGKLFFRTHQIKLCCSPYLWNLIDKQNYECTKLI